MALSFKYIKTAVDVVVKSGHVPCIIGLQGIGKSDLVKEYVLEKGYEYEEITCSLLQEGDMAMPYLSGVGENSDVKYAINSIIKGLEERCRKSGKMGILFLDEFNRPSANVQSELMNLVLQRRILAYSLPDCIRVIIAMNPSSDMKGYENSDYSVSFSDSAILGRVLTLNMSPVLSDWLEYGERVRPDGRNVIHQCVRDFLQCNINEFVTKEVAGTINNTPRGWSRVSDVLYEYEGCGLNDTRLILELLKGTLRETTASMFYKFYKENKPKVNYKTLALSTLKAKSINDWDADKLESLNDAELTRLFTFMLEYCSNAYINDLMLNNLVTFVLSASNELVYSWVMDLKETYPEIYNKMLEKEEFTSKALSVLNVGKSRKQGGFVGK